MHAIYADGETEILTECGEALPSIPFFTLAPPLIWKGYQLDRTIGEGEFAKVKLAYDLATNAPVAIKFLQTSTRGNSSCDTQGEAKLIMQLKHPHIVPVLGVHQTDNGMAIVMHYCPDGELYCLVDRLNGLEESVARGYFFQLVSAVDYLHNTMGIVHRDIKLGYYGPSADVWSCGVVLYAMVAGFLPFEEHKSEERGGGGENLFRFYNCVVKGSLQFPGKMSLALRDLLSMMLHPDAKMRPAIQDIHTHPWIHMSSRH